VIRFVANFITMALHDIGIEIRRRRTMIDPDVELTVMAIQFIQRPSRVFACGGQIAIGMQAVDMSAANERPNHFTAMVVRIPVSKLVRRHVESQHRPIGIGHGSQLNLCTGASDVTLNITFSHHPRHACVIPNSSCWRTA